MVAASRSKGIRETDNNTIAKGYCAMHPPNYSEEMKICAPHRMAEGNAVFMLLVQTLTMLRLLTCGQRTLEWPWSQARVMYTRSMGLTSNKDLALLTVGVTGQEIKVGCRMASGRISGSTYEKASQIGLYNITSNPIAKDMKLCASERLNCWYNFTLVQPVFVVCFWDHHITEPSTTTSAPIVKDKKILSPQISEIGPHYVLCRMVSMVTWVNPHLSKMNKERCDRYHRDRITTLGTNQWLLSDILPQRERINERDHQRIVDALGVAQYNVSLALSCIQAQLWMQSMVAAIIREECGPNETETHGKLLMLMHVLYRNNKDLFVRVTPSKPKTFVLTLNKMFVILKYIPMKSLKLYLYILEKDVFV
ncbi:hypothetical protein QYF61_018922 [Mycteria americana]|uniref:Uncharacterized protein n=1 Tax=Mycteria americana TaxID=33587 RepID=A0AAN7N7L8_MYCAM|nr:hypothetical protein QYF61_018922 [Mycteria americana]